ncbi:stage II sporulation protein M [Paenibacillus sp. CAU 1782]
MLQFGKFTSHLKEMRGYIGVAFVIFFAGVFIGSSNPVFSNFLDSQLEGLQRLVQSVDNSANPALTMMIIIFLNNVIKCIFVMYLGVFFGIIPVAFLIINGLLIGYLLELISRNPEMPSVLEMVAKGLLPHGIIEIPALVIACAYGMKFGSLALRGTGSFLFQRSKLQGIGAEFGFFAERTVAMIVALIVSLLVASVIESTVTVWLMSV